MARSFNYSKWDNIELSDDESDLHPNIDKVLSSYHAVLTSVELGILVSYETSFPP
jgi:hypothetical protein